METGKGKKSKIITIFFIVLFFYNAFKFIEEGGINLQITNILFNMILLVFVIMMILHKKSLIKNGLYIQKKIDDYFKSY